ncbi:MAG: peptidase M3 [Micavibrio sp.]|nr:peptidase M3 [Micavibrio sp.]
MSIDILLQPSTLPYEAPQFTGFTEDDYLPAVHKGIELAKARLESIKANPEPADFENTIEALEELEPELSRVLSVFYTYYAAHRTDKIQALAEEIGSITSAFSNDISLDADLFKRVDFVYNRKETLELDTEQAMLLERCWQSFVRNGAKLKEDEKKRLREIDQEMAKITPQYSSNIMSSSNAFELLIDDEANLRGLPKTAIVAAKESATEKNYEGQYRFVLDMPSYLPFMRYAENRSLREKMWRAASSKAFEDDFDNQENVKNIAKLRYKRAKLLGYASHADFVLEKRMAKKPKEVMSFIDKMIERAKEPAQKDLDALRALAKEDGVSDFKPWDILYYSEKLKKQLFDYDEEELRPYFKLENVIEGLFTHAEKLYGFTFKKAPENKYSVYHDDVLVYEVFNADGTFQALYYFDLFPRETKRDGAWENSFRPHGKEQGIIKKALVTNVCNFTKPTKDTPSLLSFYEVETLFHEFGHALHDICCETTYQSLGLRGVMWDFIELPSQINEQWLGDYGVLASFAKHYETGEPLPRALFDKIEASKTFMAGRTVMIQSLYSKLDMRWHIKDPSDIKDVVSFERDIMREGKMLKYEGGCFSTSFSHIFAGGYSAGYYSYLWAEVLDADAFSAFEENGLYDKETALKFRNVLAKGGSVDPMELYIEFRGREPSEEAFLKRKGLES